MPILNPHNGLQYQILKLDGSLVVILCVNGKRVSKSEISDIDTSVKEEHSDIGGARITAVGLEILLIKNNGSLEFEYVGDAGGSGSWTFDGLDMDVKSRMVATAGMQTDTMTTKDRGEQTKTMSTSDMGLQTEPAIAKEVGVQTIPLVVCSISTQTHQAPDPKELGTGSKRKSQTQKYVPNKRAKSNTSPKPWPKHLFMECQRDIPEFKGTGGILHLDLESAKMWFEGTSGSKHAECIEKKQVNLHEATIQARYQIFKTEDHKLTLSRETKASTMLRFFELTRKSNNTMWGNNDGSKSKHFTFTDPSIILDAVVHCVDRTSNRKSVHDPFARAGFEERNKKYESLEKQGLLEDVCHGNPMRSRFTWNALKEQERERLHEYNEKRQYHSISSPGD